MFGSACFRCSTLVSRRYTLIKLSHWEAAEVQCKQGDCSTAVCSHRVSGCCSRGRHCCRVDHAGQCMSRVVTCHDVVTLSSRRPCVDCLGPVSAVFWLPGGGAAAGPLRPPPWVRENCTNFHSPEFPGQRRDSHAIYPQHYTLPRPASCANRH